MVFFVLFIFAIIFVPIGLMLTLEDKEEQNSIVPVKKTTEAPMAKTAKTTPATTNTPGKQFWTSMYSTSRIIVQCFDPRVDQLCNEAFIGDGYCDGACNIPDHNYDEGDCCSTTITYNYCSYYDCTCYCYPEDIQYQEYEAPPSGGLPPTSALPSENLCIPEPSCGINAKLMPPMDFDSITSVSVVDEDPIIALCNPAFIGDGICDGACNKINPDNDYATTEDDWDGGDCCIPPVSSGFYTFCNRDCCECFCYPEGIQYEEPEETLLFGGDVPPIPGPPIAPEPGSCPESFKGDSYCDAQCNNEENEYDDGDCCLAVILDQYCLNGPPPGCMCHE